jgi:purine-nucleoside phosphorylase
MSTAPEAVAAANEGVPVLGISVITNVARPDSPETVDAEDVVVASHAAANNVLSVVETAIKQ